MVEYYLIFFVIIFFVSIFLILCYCKNSESYTSREIGSDPADLYQTLYGPKSRGDLTQNQLNADESTGDFTQSSINNMFNTTIKLPRDYKQNTGVSMYQYPLSNILR